MRPLSNIDIGQYYRKNPKFGGVVSKDQLYKQEPVLRFNDRRVFIVNMEDSDRGGGTHWVALSFLNPECGVYFDSYSTSPPSNILDLMKRHRSKNVMNEGGVQSLESTSCGWYCIYILDMLLKGRKYLDILEDFTDDYQQNEKVLYNYFKQSKKLRP